MYMERILNLIDTSAKDLSLSIIEAISNLKEQLRNCPADFPEFLGSVEMNELTLGEEKFHQYEVLKVVLDESRLIPPKLREGILNNRILKACFQDDKEKITEAMNELLIRLSGMLHTLFFKLLDVGFLALKPMLSLGRHQYHAAVRNKLFKQNYVCNDYRIDDLGHRAENKIGELHESFSQSRREQLCAAHGRGADELNVENMVLFAQPEDMPIVFVEHYCRSIEEKDQVPPFQRPSIKQPSQQIPSHSIENSTKDSNSINLLTSKPKEDLPPVENIKPRTKPGIISEDSDQEEDKTLEMTEARASEIKKELDALPDDDEAQLTLTDKVVSSSTKNDSHHQQPDHTAIPQRISMPCSPQIGPKLDDVHLAIFVHGYEGCSFDMKLLKNMFCFLAKPNVVFHSATANEADSTGDIDQQGALLAGEIEELIKINFKPNELRKISFFGHSLGGLVVRAALPRLRNWKDRFHAFFTFGTPHLGVANGSSFLVRLGMKVFSSFVSHKSLNQMSLSDKSELKDCYLFKLSSYEGIEWFEHFIVFSSFQDLYVPYESARIEYGDIEVKDKKRSHLFKRMVQNILGRVKGGRIVRVDMNLKQNSSLNSRIGRSAHIRILDNLELQTAIAYFFVEYLH